jgi:hypothetical protein
MFDKAQVLCLNPDTEARQPLAVIKKIRRSLPNLSVDLSPRRETTSAVWCLLTAYEEAPSLSLTD